MALQVPGGHFLIFYFRVAKKFGFQGCHISGGCRVTISKSSPFVQNCSICAFKSSVLANLATQISISFICSLICAVSMYSGVLVDGSLEDLILNIQLRETWLFDFDEWPVPRENEASEQKDALRWLFSNDFIIFRRGAGSYVNAHPECFVFGCARPPSYGVHSMDCHQTETRISTRLSINSCQLRNILRRKLSNSGQKVKVVSRLRCKIDRFYTVVC